jgi:DNA-binding response OmpR family regulator
MRPAYWISAMSPVTNRRPHILVVDDDRGILTMLELALAHEQYSVATAASCEEALAAVRRERPDAVLIDLRLHDEDGIALAREIREVCDARLVLMTAGERPAAAARHAAADAWLMKPFDLADLYGVVEGVLRQPSAVD